MDGSEAANFLSVCFIRKVSAQVYPFNGYILLLLIDQSYQLGKLDTPPPLENQVYRPAI